MTELQNVKTKLDKSMLQVCKEKLKTIRNIPYIHQHFPHTTKS